MINLRAILEERAAARAATPITLAELEELRAVDARLAASVVGRVPAIAGFVAENQCFQDIVIATASSPRLSAILASLVEQLVVHCTAARYYCSEFARSGHEHGELIQAFAAQDPAWATAVMTAHIRRAFHAVAAADPAALPAVPAV